MNETHPIQRNSKKQTEQIFSKNHIVSFILYWEKIKTKKAILVL